VNPLRGPQGEERIPSFPVTPR